MYGIKLKREGEGKDVEIDETGGKKERVALKITLYINLMRSSLIC